MKGTSLGLMMVMSLTAHAQVDGLKAYKSKTGNSIELADDAFIKAVNGKTPVCVKDGGRVISVNDTFESMELKSRDCSSSDANLKKYKALGYEVTVIKLSELSPRMIKAVMGKK